MNTRYKNYRGFSLLEVLVVLAIVMIFSQYAISYWQAQQYPIKREMAWLQLQHILLEQMQYHVIHQVYATDLADILLQNPMHIGYDYGLSMTDDGFIVSAQVQVAGAQAADIQCWQLRLDQQGNKTAVDKTGGVSLACY